MNKPSRFDITRRLFKVAVTTIGVTIIALAPAFLASMVLTQDAAESNEASDYATTLNVTDINQNDTVMYTVSPSHRSFEDAPGIATDVGAELLRDADLIKVTIYDEDLSTGWIGSDPDNECKFTLHFSDDDKQDRKFGTYTGYLRIRDDGLQAHHSMDHDSRCGFVITYADESK